MRDGGPDKIIHRLIKFPLHSILLRLQYKRSVYIFDALLGIGKYNILQWVFPLHFSALI